MQVELLNVRTSQGLTWTNKERVRDNKIRKDRRPSADQQNRRTRPVEREDVIMTD